MLADADLIGRRARTRCPVCGAVGKACTGHGPALLARIVNIGDSPNLEAIPMGDTNTSGVIGVKTEDDIEQQATATGPLAYGYRQPVKEGAKHGYRGEAEGLVEVRDATERAQVKAETRIAQRSGDAAVGIKVRPSREPDYLKGERPNVSADAGKGEGLGSKTRAELDQIAAAEGVDVSDAKNKGDVVSAIERARAASSPPQPETE